jgi:hypothetical protein
MISNHWVERNPSQIPESRHEKPILKAGNLHVAEE